MSEGMIEEEDSLTSSDMPATSAEQPSLAEPMMLEKIDKLFACGVREMVALPQIVVVGDQSSGKSSVLEGLIKKPFPRDSGLCTRFATRIIFRRCKKERVVVSIVPSQDASHEHRSRVKKWGKSISSLSTNTFRIIMQEAHEQMGLLRYGSEETSRPTFSKDVLQLEISGPNQEHLTVIDVPGIFKSTTEGLTTKADIQLVRDMVKRYMHNPRSIILAVVPANTDLATQEILELAAEADVHGDRTLGILTKPDLVDKGAECNIMDLVEGRARPMKLGWHIIRNPGQNQLDMADDRGSLETEFFQYTQPWDKIDESKAGIDSLRFRLREVLSMLVKAEFPKVQTEIKARLDSRRKRLIKLGPERNSSVEQMAYLIELTTKFQRLVSLALSAAHGADDLFETYTALRIAPAVMSRMKAFSDDMNQYGHTYAFLIDADGSGNTTTVKNTGLAPQLALDIRKEADTEDLADILCPQKSLTAPQNGQIQLWLLQTFQGNRGFELGTFNGSVLATIMKKQSTKWADLSTGFVCDVIVVVHRFILTALSSVCGDPKIRDSLFAESFPDLTSRYQKALDNTNFLLQVECSNTPMTMNHYFNENLQKTRQDKSIADLQKSAVNTNFGMAVRVDHASQVIIQRSNAMSNDQHITRDIHDVLHSYYKVSRKTFVDSVCKQSVMHFLLESAESPLALFSPILVSQLSADRLQDIAGEAPASRRAREQLNKEIASLVEATKILARA